jgi:hypothetical protein
MMKSTLLIGAIALLLADGASASAKTMICVGEPGTGKAIGGKQSIYHEFADSVVGDCLFVADDQIGRRIESVCHIGEIGGTDPGIPCRIEADVVRKGIRSGLIKRIIKIERLP